MFLSFFKVFTHKLSDLVVIIREENAFYTCYCKITTYDSNKGKNGDSQIYLKNQAIILLIVAIQTVVKWVPLYEGFNGKTTSLYHLCHIFFLRKVI